MAEPEMTTDHVATATVRVERRGSVAVITLARPERLNALDEPTRGALLEALQGAGNDDEVLAIVLTGEGRGFCVGQDLGAPGELDDCEDTVARTYNPIALTLARLELPVVAAVNGAAVGAGMGIALGCDVVIMSEAASFSCAFGKVGLVPDTGTSWYLARLVGHLRSFELSTTGRRVGAQEALSLGLATEVVAADELVARAIARAEELAAGPALAFALTKLAIRRSLSESLESVLAFEAEAQGRAGASLDHLTLRAAFLNR